MKIDQQIEVGTISKQVRNHAKLQMIEKFKWRGKQIRWVFKKKNLSRGI
jgi:hypothetical protein